MRYTFQAVEVAEINTDAVRSLAQGDPIIADAIRIHGGNDTAARIAFNAEIACDDRRLAEYLAEIPENPV